MSPLNVLIAWWPRQPTCTDPYEHETLCKEQSNSMCATQLCIREGDMLKGHLTTQEEQRPLGEGTTRLHPPAF